MASNSKRFLLLGILFSAFAVVFTILYHFHIISRMDLFLTATYVSYFVGLALMYNGAYNREHSHKNSTLINFIFGAIFILLSIGLLVYGLITGVIILF